MLSSFILKNLNSKQCFCNRALLVKLILPQHSISTKNFVTNVADKGTTIYSYNSDRFYKMLSIFGALQTVFWINMAFSLRQLPEVDTSKKLTAIADFQINNKDRLAITGGLLGKNHFI